MDQQAAILHIKSQTGDRLRYKVHRRGFIDWKFGELAEYMGFERAVNYTESALKWVDNAAAGSLLHETYLAFRQAEATLNQTT